MTPVSVLVTVYNRERFLAATLDSILASQFKDFELLIVDDQSTDQSLEIAENYAQKDARIKLHRNEQNLGDYGNRMKAAQLAVGKFLKYVDSDDLIYPHSLRVMVDAMERHSDAAVGLAHSMPEDEEPYPWKLTSADAYQKHFLGRGCLSCGPTGAIIRKSAFDEVGGFRREWGVLSDTDLWLRLAATFPIVLLPPGLVWWRRHEDQEFTKDDAAAVYLRRGHELDMLALNDDSCPLSKSSCRLAVSRRKHVHARRILATALRKFRPFTAVELFRKSRLGYLDLVGGFRSFPGPSS